MTEMITIAPTFHPLSRNLPILVKETSVRKSVININYVNNIPFPFFFCFVKALKRVLLLFR